MDAINLYRKHTKDTLLAMQAKIHDDTADIIAAIEADLAATEQPPCDAKTEQVVNTGGLLDFAIALGIWAAWGLVAVGVTWLLG